jgi:hypothetical protein
MTLNGGREVGWLQASARAKKTKTMNEDLRKIELRRNPVETTQVANLPQARVWDIHIIEILGL